MTTTNDLIVKAIIDLTAGCAGGIANVVVGQPLDTIKVKLQTFPRLYSSALVCGYRTLQQEGVVGLYAGTGPALVANIAEDALLFLAYGATQRMAVKQLKGLDGMSEEAAILALTPFENACAGSVASVACGVVLTPVELVKCRLQALREKAVIEGRTVKRIGSMRLTGRIIKHEGPSALFKGLEASLVRKTIGYFFFFGAYELSRDAFVSKTGAVS